MALLNWPTLIWKWILWPFVQEPSFRNGGLSVGHILLFSTLGT